MKIDLISTIALFASVATMVRRHSCILKSGRAHWATRSATRSSTPPFAAERAERNIFVLTFMRRFCSDLPLQLRASEVNDLDALEIVNFANEAAAFSRMMEAAKDRYKEEAADLRLVRNGCKKRMRY